MNYELAKQLKDAGFAQTGHGLVWIDGYDVFVFQMTVYRMVLQHVQHNVGFNIIVKCA